MSKLTLALLTSVVIVCCMQAQGQLVNRNCPITASAPQTACDCVTPAVLGTTCVNGGFCRSNNLMTFSCLCPPAAMGAQCQTTSSPACTVGTMNCLGANSQCVSVQGVGTCTCDAGFVRLDTGAAGEACIPLTNECNIAQPCLNGGTCIDLPVQFMCRCPAGFTGDMCQTVFSSGSDEDSSSADGASSGSAGSASSADSLSR